ncbi:hypothetical protein EVC37_17780 [Methylocaldum sp. BRCS4]|jgi:hypothetical protein|nr:hypothetical protein [Methylocaldum sp. BRCS4]
MINFSGAVTGKLRYPYIYTITKGHCIYIGETQKHPVSRWGEHLAPNGNFMRRLREMDEALWANSKEILFLCVACEQISNLAQEEQRIVTQYVEHEIHVQCILNFPMLYPIEKIISDTTRTAPALCRHSWAKELARAIFIEICSQLAKWKPAFREPLNKSPC